MGVPVWAYRLVRLTRRAYFADFFLTPPITLGLAAYSIREDWSLLWPAWVAVGWLAWTLYEYATHRWLAHRAWGFRELHRLHHDRQRDYIALPPWATVAIYVSFAIAFGVRSTPFSVGFGVGYVWYAALHTAFHYATIKPGNPLYAGRRRHVAHHRYDDVCYGVTHGLWDRAFGTEWRRRPGRGLGPAGTAMSLGAEGSCRTGDVSVDAGATSTT